MSAGDVGRSAGDVGRRSDTGMSTWKPPNSSSPRRGVAAAEPNVGDRPRVGESPPELRSVRAAWSGLECTRSHTGGSRTVPSARISSACCFEAASSATASRTLMTLELLRRLAVRGETAIRVGLAVRGESAIRVGLGLRERGDSGGLGENDAGDAIVGSRRR